MLTRRQWLTTSVGALAALFGATSVRTAVRATAAKTTPAETGITTASTSTAAAFRVTYAMRSGSDTCEVAIIEDGEIVGWKPVKPPRRSGRTVSLDA